MSARDVKDGEIARGVALDPERYRDLTAARIRLGRGGAVLSTGAEQSFLLDHARARDAVWSEVDWPRLEAGLLAADLSCARVASAVPDRATYIRRPDLGRALSEDGAERVARLAQDMGSPRELLIVVGDGLSATAVDLVAGALVIRIAEAAAKRGVSIGPVILAEGARVALGDPIAEAFGAKVVVMLLGERPGLSAADSLGAYVTYGAKTGTPDSRRNCISNIREGGLTIDAATGALMDLVAHMLRRRISGVKLADATAALVHREASPEQGTGEP